MRRKRNRTTCDATGSITENKAAFAVIQADDLVKKIYDVIDKSRLSLGDENNNMRTRSDTMSPFFSS